MSPICFRIESEIIEKLRKDKALSGVSITYAVNQALIKYVESRGL